MVALFLSVHYSYIWRVVTIRGRVTDYGVLFMACAPPLPNYDTRSFTDKLERACVGRSAVHLSLTAAQSPLVTLDRGRIAGGERSSKLPAIKRRLGNNPPGA